MPGRFFLETPLADVASWMGAGDGGLTEMPRHNIAPGEEIIVCPPIRELMRMRWGMIPVGRVNARGRPVMETVINARSETVFDKSAFTGVGRAIVPCDGWYEWTGEKRRKKPWRIRPVDGGLMAFAAISDVWEAPGGRTIHQVAVVTCEPSADVRDIHHRMGVILTPDQFETWLTGDQASAKALMKPYPDGLLQVEAADDVDFSDR
ncbi:MAG: SOS response-associated peptidase [Silicimonas sp.]|nr:SOS response-associated peptidase [Silicimonas sp.]